MATYAQLKELSEHMDKLDTSVFMDFDVEEMPYHMPSRVIRASEAFYAANKNVPGIMNPTVWDDPEPMKGAFLNNYALTHLPELMPLIDEMNKHLDESKLNESDYSKYVLGSAAEINCAVKNDMEKDKIDYLCEIAVTKEWSWGGYRSRVVEARRRFYDGETVEHARFIDDLKDENMQSVDFYREFCSENNLPVNDKALHVIGTAANMGVAYGLQDAIKYNNLSADEAKAISSCLDDYVKAAYDKNVNYKYEAHWIYKDDKGVEHDESSMHSRFDTFANESVVEDIIHMEDFRHHPKTLKKLVNDFINDKSTYTEKEEGETMTVEYKKPYTCLSHYYEDHKEQYAELLAEETKSIPKKDFECRDIQNAYDEPYVVETISVIDNKPFAYEASDRIGHVFNIELSNELADKLGVYHDAEFKGMIQYATYLDGSDPEIKFCEGSKLVHKYDYEYNGHGDFNKKIESSHMERVMTNVNDVENKFTKSQLDTMRDITNSVMSESFPGFKMDENIITYENVLPEKKSMDKSKAVSSEFGDIQAESEGISGPKYQ